MTTEEKAIAVLSKLINEQYTATQIEDILHSWICYGQFYKKKKKGGKRLLNAPDSSLKELQHLLLHNVLYRFPVHENMFGFVPGVSMKEGVCTHLIPFCGQHVVSQWLLHIDLKNCFPSVQANVLQNMFEDIFTELLWNCGVRDVDVFVEFCKIVVKLTTYHKQLTQGAPTSPYLTNLVISWSGIADDLEEYCNRKGLLFSIYADDIVISSTRSCQISVKKIIECIEEKKIFSVNPTKTHLNHSEKGSHRITGMSIYVPKLWSNDGYVRLTLPKKRQKFYRGRIWQAIRLLQEGYIPSKKEHGISIEQVQGYITWIRHVCDDQIPSSLRKPIAHFEKMLT